MKWFTLTRKTVICTLFCATLITLIAVKAADISLNFNSLPSAQGWTYFAQGNTAPESRVFSVSSGTLFQNSIGVGFAGSGSNRYNLNGVVDPQAAFILTVRARVLQEETQANNHFGFSFGFFTGTEQLGIGLGTNVIQDNTNGLRTFSHDNTQFHEYRLEGAPGIGYRLYVDGQFFISGPTIPGNFQNSLFLGDGTAGANARAEVTSYRYVTVPRSVKAGNASGAPGGTVTVPIELVALGDENSLGFSITFDTSVLSNPLVVLGADAANATLIQNPSQITQGRLGIAIALPTTEKFAAGTRRLVNVTFNIAANALPTTRTIGFSDQPIGREIVSDSSNVLPSSFMSGALTVIPGYEADVSPRPNGTNNGSVTIADWVQVGRFAAGADSLTAGSEFQRADCAPKDTKGDGRVSIADWVQAGRYAAGVDAVVTAGGPTAPVSGLQVATDLKVSEIEQQARVIRAMNASFQRGQNGTLVVELDAQGNENASGFSLNFDPAQLRFVSASVGSGAANASLNPNSIHAESGRVGIALALPTGQTFAAGTKQLLVITFAALSSGNGATTTISLGDSPVSREIVDAAANTLTATWAAATVTLARSVASVSAASFNGEVLASEAIVAAFGGSLATATQIATTVPLPTSLAGTSVRVKDSAGVERLAPLFFVAPAQVNYLVPAGTAAGEAVVTITSGDGVVSIGKVRISNIGPGVFSADASGRGLAAATVLRVKADGTQSFEPVGRFDPALNRFVPTPLDLGPATDQVFLILFGTGIRHRGALSAVTASIGGVTSEVLYAGEQGGFAGLDQINVRLPRALIGRGEVNVGLLVENQESNLVQVVIK